MNRKQLVTVWAGILIISCVLFAGCGSKARRTSREIKLQRVGRQEFLAQIKASNPGNWHAELVEYDLKQMRDRQQADMGLDAKVAWINYEQEIIVAHGGLLRAEYDKLNSAYLYFLSTLSDEQVKNYQELVSSTSDGSTESAELFRRRIPKVLQADQVKKLGFLANLSLSLNQRFQKLFGQADTLAQEKIALRGAIQVRAARRAYAWQAAAKGFQGAVQPRYQYLGSNGQIANELNNINRNLQGLRYGY